MFSLLIYFKTLGFLFMNPAIAHSFFLAEEKTKGLIRAAYGEGYFSKWIVNIWGIPFNSIPVFTSLYIRIVFYQNQLPSTQNEAKKGK